MTAKAVKSEGTKARNEALEFTAVRRGPDAQGDGGVYEFKEDL